MPHYPNQSLQHSHHIIITESAPNISHQITTQSPLDWHYTLSDSPQTPQNICVPERDPSPLLPFDIDMLLDCLSSDRVFRCVQGLAACCKAAVAAALQSLLQLHHASLVYFATPTDWRQVDAVQRFCHRQWCHKSSRSSDGTQHQAPHGQHKMTWTSDFSADEQSCDRRVGEAAWKEGKSATRCKHWQV